MQFGNRVEGSAGIKSGADRNDSKKYRSTRHRYATVELLPGQNRGVGHSDLPTWVRDALRGPLGQYSPKVASLVEMKVES